MDFIPSFCTSWTCYIKTQVMMGKFKQLGLEPGQGPVAILGAGISGTAAKLLLEKKGWRTNIFDDEKISFRKKDAQLL